jgi:hypothetical protein
MGLLIVLVLSLALNTVYCDMGMEELPVVIEFGNLGFTDNFTSAIKELKGSAGVYAIKCLITGGIYIGSSVNLGKRIQSHFTDSSNIHQKRAILLYGAAAFTIIIVEFIELQPGVSSEVFKQTLLAREQVYLTWLFSTLPKERIYNF